MTQERRLDDPAVRAADPRLVPAARRALVVSLVCLPVCPFVLVVLAWIGLRVADAANIGSFGLLALLALAAGASAGIPGIVLARRALRNIAPVVPDGPAGQEARRRATWLARAALGVGILTSVAGALLHALLVVLVGMGAPGRPFRRRGVSQKPGLRSDRAWCGPTAPVPPLDARERARRAHRWTQAARAEHASIAAFCRTTLDLLALGAPPELVDRALAAARDEVAHARRSFALASAYAGAPVSAGPLEAAADAGTPGRLAFALGSLADGWVNEGVAAIDAADGAADADNEVERGTLATIAADEARHAALGRDLAAWALGQTRLSG